MEEVLLLDLQSACFSSEEGGEKNTRKSTKPKALTPLGGVSFYLLLNV